MLRSSLLSTVSTVHWSPRGLANLKRLSATSGLTSIAATDHIQCSLGNFHYFTWTQRRCGEIAETANKRRRTISGEYATRFKEIKSVSFE